MKYRLRSGQSLEVWPVHPKKPDIKRLIIIGVQGGYKGTIEFTQDDLPIIIEALNEAAKREQKPAVAVES